MAAGGVVCGTESVISEIRRGKARAVLVASDASERTRKQIRDKCTFYGVEHYTINESGEALASVIGKRSFCAAVSLNGKGPYKKVIENISTYEKCDDRDESRKDDL